MKFRNRLSWPAWDGLEKSTPCLPRLTCRLEIPAGYFETDDFCRTAKTSVTAIRTPMAALMPEFFASGFSFSQPQMLLRDLELLPLPVGKIQDTIDWRICGDQDPPMDE